MKKGIATIVVIIALGAAAFAVAVFLTNLQPQDSSDTTNSQQQSADEKAEPGVVQEETGPKPNLPEKAGDVDDSHLSPEQQQRRDAKQNQ